MALIYNKTNSTGTEKATILAVRESFLRGFNVGTWTDLRIGFWFTTVTAAGDNTASVNEVLTISASAPNCPVMGIKTNNSTLPQLSSSGRFLGVMSKLTDTSTSFFGGSSGGYITSMGVIGTNDTAYLAGSQSGTANSVSVGTSTTAAATTVYCARVSFRFKVNNIGTSTQTVTVYCDASAGIGGRTSSTADMAALGITLEQMTTGDFTSATITMNDGSAALTLPDAVFLYFPYYNNRLRVHGMGVMKFA